MLTFKHIEMAGGKKAVTVGFTLHNNTAQAFKSLLTQRLTFSLDIKVIFIETWIHTFNHYCYLHLFMLNFQWCLLQSYACILAAHPT